MAKWENKNRSRADKGERDDEPAQRGLLNLVFEFESSSFKRNLTTMGVFGRQTTDFTHEPKYELRYIISQQ